jgi:hypothetical protein
MNTVLKTCIDNFIQFFNSSNLIQSLSLETNDSNIITNKHLSLYNKRIKKVFEEFEIEEKDEDDNYENDDVLKNDEIIKSKKYSDSTGEEKNEKSTNFFNNSLLLSNLSDSPFISQSQSLCEICFPKLIKLNKNVLIENLNFEEKSKSRNGFFSRFKKSISDIFLPTPPVINNSLSPSSNLIKSSCVPSIDSSSKVLDCQTINQKNDIDDENVLAESKNPTSILPKIHHQNTLESQLIF